MIRLSPGAMCPVTYCLAVAHRPCLCGPAHGSMPCGPASYRLLRPSGTDARIYCFTTKSHLCRPGRGTPIEMRNPGFIGCGAVSVVGIKHAQLQVQGGCSRDSYRFLPEGFKNQILPNESDGHGKRIGVQWIVLGGSYSVVRAVRRALHGGELL